ncbi:hypothetical protein SDRG_05686 [Saprolegnia diclina VS20]|uniref:Uncharacterized protein n=1 Tax=Saprolegnia diclina (strain VS20) TaxID=1156394 RepID=T0QQ26_SAPDV|nr:hypothetical protein SDRG_05686 [Saprolegnia diclina VS20]EQC36856.1 hypothetical protein SDRG_05686 [Saprolegnia diclina VS20]|eukprot:XP_008609637.1 hypothetical protein SDRG_05686 [Saprolegnia diclina VS20]
MSRVAPGIHVVRAANAPVARDRSDDYGRADAVAGLSYLVLSLACGVWYLVLLAPYFANDLWWAAFDAPVHQAYLVDVANTLLATTHGSSALDLQAPRAMVHKVYAGDASTDVWPSYARHVLLNELTSIEYAVPQLRQLSASWSMRIAVQHCWVDFEQKFQVAHTTRRQQRCATHFSSDGGVYFESILRNTRWTEFLGVWGGENGPFTLAIQRPLLESARGRSFLDSVQVARESKSVDDEIAYWRQFGLDRFQVQWQNHGQPGVAESVVLTNALQMQQVVSIKNVPRATGPWTSSCLFWLPLNDLWTGQSLNRSMVRGTATYFGTSLSSAQPAVDLEVVSGYGDSRGHFENQSALFRSHIGPFLSVDSFYVPVPRALQDAYDAFQSALYRQLLSTPGALARSTALETTSVGLRPPQFANTSMYYGGSPLCFNNAGTSFPQEAFDFVDDCSSSIEMTASWSPDGAFFALAMATPASIAGACAAAVPSGLCSARLQAALSLLQELSVSSDDLRAKANAVAQALNVSLMQYVARVDGSWTLASQPLHDPSFAYFGWLLLSEWAMGVREVVSFQGDVGTLTLVSSASTAQAMPTGTQPLETATKGVFYLVVATSVGLGAIGLLTIAYVLVGRLHFQGRHLFSFNRIVGAVWVGRPLLFLRGVTAILLLSSASVDLLEAHGYTRLVTKARPLVQTLVIAGEATWLSYVLHELLSIVVPPHVTKGYSPIATFITWFAILLLDVASPVGVSMTLDRHCVGTDINYAVRCTSGVIANGNLMRVGTLLALVLCTSVGSLLVHWWRTPTSQHDDCASLLLPGIANTFLSTRTSHDETLVDDVACVLSGLLPLHLARAVLWRRSASSPTIDLFDYKLWVRVPVLRSVSLVNAKVLCRPTLTLPSSPVAINVGPSVPVSVSPDQRRLIRRASASLLALTKHVRLLHLWRILGFVYMLMAIASSVSYLEVSQINLGNDLFWATFNTTGAHVFIANWLHEQLLLGKTSLIKVALDGPSVSAMASYLQRDVLSRLPAAIQGLRVSDPCAAPWIFTPYCYVDLNQTALLDNGALFLETVLRNVEFAAFSSCWGVAFEIAVASELKRSVAGRAWLTTLASQARPSIADEAHHWSQFGIRHFTVQWQNYKRIGLNNMYAITNAYGVSYPLTLQAQSGVYRLSSQTSFKMYWSLANDFVAVASNTTLVGGLSLLRSSARFAFANTTPAAMLQQNGTLLSPISAGFALVTHILGPFGSIDMVYVPVPRRLREIVGALVDRTRVSLANDLDAQAAYRRITPLDASFPVPTAWRVENVFTLGGSPLCPEINIAYRVSQGLFGLPSSTAICHAAMGVAGPITPTRQQLIVAALLASSPVDTSAACQGDINFVSQCEAYLGQVTSYIDAYDLAGSPTDTALAAAEVAPLQIEFFAYTKVNVTDDLSVRRTLVLNATDPDFTFFAWMYLYDWVLGRRDVVTFVGDVGFMTLLFDLEPPLSQPPDASQVTANVAQYLRAGIVYVTCVVLAVAAVACLYIVRSQFQFEGLNMLELGRVGAVTWVGRPLLLLRSTTALCVLSTATLELRFSGVLSAFSNVPTPWYATLLAANEVTWLVAVVNDLSLVLTQAYTPYYVTPNGLLVSALVALLSFLQPVRATLDMDLRCDIVDLDLDVACTTGIITIGRLDRFVLLISLVIAVNGLCYLVTRRLVQTPTAPVASLFLSAGARFLFAQPRQHDGIYFLDPASAALNGILTWHTHDQILALDVKLWRTFVIAAPHRSRPDALAAAWPLLA